MVEVIETLVAVKTSVAMPDLDFKDLTKDLIPKDLTKTMAALVNTTPLIKKHLKPGPVSSELIDLLPLMKKHLKPGPVSSELIDLLPLMKKHLKPGPVSSELIDLLPLVKKHLKPGPVSSELIDLLPLVKKHLKPGPVSSELIDLLHRSSHSRAGHLNLRQETQNADFMVMLKCPTLRHKCATPLDLMKDLMRPSLI